MLTFIFYTLYSPQTVHQFLQLLSLLLSENTICLVATQRYYFGVGGGYQCLLNTIEQFVFSIHSVDVLELSYESRCAEFERCCTYFKSVIAIVDFRKHIMGIVLHLFCYHKDMKRRNSNYSSELL